MSNVHDTRGFTCPQPVMVTPKALLEAQQGEIIVRVGTMTQAENCTRMAYSLGRHVSHAERRGAFELTLRRQDGITRGWAFPSLPRQQGADQCVFGTIDTVHGNDHVVSAGS
jgi:TusA-related sulfurtransferase